MHDARDFDASSTLGGWVDGDVVSRLLPRGP